jgi:hypothetical protein
MVSAWYLTIVRTPKSQTNSLKQVVQVAEGSQLTSNSQVLGLLVNGEYAFFAIAFRFRLLPTRAPLSFLSDIS